MTHREQPAVPTRRDGEQGFALAFAVVMVALVLIALSVAAPVVARDLRRDKEVESIHRADQYDRAIRLYYRKFKSYPPSMEALEKSNNIRFLRQKYVDPLTGKADWRLIHVGQNQTTVKGFFGEPLGGLNATGAGGGLGSASTLASGTPGTPGSSSTIGQTSGLAAGFQGATVGTDPTAGTPGASGATGSSTGTSAFGAGGAGPIMGVGTSRTGDSLSTPNEQSTYETWEFLYDPRIEAMYQKGALGGGIGSTSATGVGNSNGLNADPNNPNNPKSPAIGTSGGGTTAPTPGTTPQ